MKANEEGKKKRRRNTVFEVDLCPLRREIESYERLKDEEGMDKRGCFCVGRTTVKYFPSSFHFGRGGLL